MSLLNETLLQFREAAKRLPGTRPGRCLSRWTLRRWIGRGVRGVRLESVVIGGRIYTSVEALARFHDEQQRRRPQPADRSAFPPARIDPEREVQRGRDAIARMKKVR